MRTLPFREVFNEVVVMHGRDAHAEVASDMRNALVQHINHRVREVCQGWRWPEWELTEERAFRTVWNANDQYLKASVTDGRPDEVFYIPNMTYYKVSGSAVADPVVGVAPPDATDTWEIIESPDTFLDYDQRCKRSIGMVLGIYSQNPRVPTGSNNGMLKYAPSERGIDVMMPGNPTVFVTYKMPVPRYTMVPYVTGKSYPKGHVVFDPTVGECFQALAPTTAIPSDTFFWRRVPFPERWLGYVTEMSFSDSLLEFDQGGGADAQVKLLLSQAAGERAKDFLQIETDSLIAQGQILQWNFCKRHQYWCESVPWNGGSVSTLSDVCEDELGWIYPVPPEVPGVAWQYRPDINSLRTVAPALNSVATRNLMPKSLIQIVILESGNRTAMQFEIVTGAADLTDPNGQVAPLDYSSSNDKHWNRLT